MDTLLVEDQELERRLLERRRFGKKRDAWPPLESPLHSFWTVLPVTAGIGNLALFERIFAA